jgi:flagellar assembly protein FliH
MLIKSENVISPEMIRDHEFPTDEVGVACAEPDEDKPITAERYLETIETLQQELATTRENSYSDGFQAGEKAGFNQALETIQPSIDSFAELLDSIRSQQEEIISSSDKFVVDFALVVVEKIIGDEQFSTINIGRSKLEKIVEDALNLFADSTKFIIRINKKTADMLEQYKSEIREQLSRPVALSIVDDPSLRPCDCLIESEHGVLDARIDSQLKEIKSVFNNK